MKKIVIILQQHCNIDAMLLRFSVFVEPDIDSQLEKDNI